MGFKNFGPNTFSTNFSKFVCPGEIRYSVSGSYEKEYWHQRRSSNMAYKSIENYSMPQSRLWGGQKGFKGSRLQWAQTLGKDMAEAHKFERTGKLKEMSDLQRIAEYNKTVKHMPVPSDFAVMNAANEYYGIEVDITDSEKLEELRKWMFNKMNPTSGAADVNIDTGVQVKEKAGDANTSNKQAKQLAFITKL